MTLDLPSLHWPAAAVRSLAWDGDELVDWVDGGRRHRLDGSMIDRRVAWGFGFDAALTLPDSGYAVIYTRLGTKGLVLSDGKILREINRSYYFAQSYEYPIALGRLPSGREVLVHCPDEYNRLDVEDLATGERLTGALPRELSDVFHSRLAISPDSRHLLGAGWVWHPMQDVQAYDLTAALADPRCLDGRGVGIDAWCDGYSSASFLPDGRIVVWLMDYEDDESHTPMSAGVLRIFDPTQPTAVDVVGAVGCLGTILAVDNEHVLALHGHPRLIELTTGAAVRHWPEVHSGEQRSSIIDSDELPPPTALDAANRRCAIADDTGITVIRW